MTNLRYVSMLHPAQKTIFTDKTRFRVAVNGRRFGKSRLVLDELINASLSYTGEMSKTSPQMVLGCLPTAVQARQILFKPLVELFTTTDLQYAVEKINLSNMTIALKGKPTIKVVGANDRNGDRLRGNRILFIALDEMQDISPVAWIEVVRPAMSDTVGSRALFTGTPKSKLNYLYDLSQQEQLFPGEWKFFNYTTADNPFVSRREIAQAKLTLPPRVYEQEYEASFVNFTGQIWDNLDSCNIVQPDTTPTHFDLVVMGLDWGDKYPSAVVCGLDRLSNCWYLIDSWSPNVNLKRDPETITRSEFQRCVSALVLKHDVDRIFADPSQPSSILAVRDFGDHRGFKSCVAAFNPIAEGTTQVGNLVYQNRLLVSMFVPSEQEAATGYLSGHRVYEFMQSYHWETNRQGILTEVPADGLFAHTCDALRYALAHKGG